MHEEEERERETASFAIPRYVQKLINRREAIL